MLTKDAVLSTIALSMALAEQGKVAQAKPNTVVSELVRTTNAVFLSIPEPVNSDPAPITNETFTYFAEMVEQTTSGTLEKPSEHDKTFDAFIDEISMFVSRHLSFARNVVKPIVVEYADAVQAYTTNFQSIGQFQRLYL